MVPWALHLTKLLHVGLGSVMPDPAGSFETIKALQQLPDRTSVSVYREWLHVGLSVNAPMQIY